MLKIAKSLMMIGVVAALAIGITGAFFSDIEKSTDNIINAGVIDIVVDDTNPWNRTTPYILDDMKPCNTQYIEFTVRNLVDSNPINLWKHIYITEQNDGYITEPECDECGGDWVGGTTGAMVCTDASQCCTGSYVPRNNLAAYIIYDMWVCDSAINDCNVDENGKPTGDDWRVIIDENQHVRLDNVSCAWIELGKLEPGEKMKVVQSYHLRSWPDAPDAEVTNWAQGDQLKFDIELMATQLNSPGPKGYQTTLKLDNKDAGYQPITTDDIEATMTYKTEGETFDYSLVGKTKNASTDYCLIYYADPWASYGSGMTGITGALIGKATSDANKDISIPSTQVELNTDLPNPDDKNYPTGAKVWLIPCSDYNTTTPGDQGKMTGWNPSEYLFEMQYILYDDTQI